MRACALALIVDDGFALMADGRGNGTEQRGEESGLRVWWGVGGWLIGSVYFLSSWGTVPFFCLFNPPPLPTRLPTTAGGGGAGGDSDRRAGGGDAGVAVARVGQRRLRRLRRQGPAVVFDKPGHSRLHRLFRIPPQPRRPHLPGSELTFVCASVCVCVCVCVRPCVCVSVVGWMEHVRMDGARTHPTVPCRTYPRLFRSHHAPHRCGRSGWTG